MRKNILILGLVACALALLLLGLSTVQAAPLPQNGAKPILDFNPADVVEFQVSELGKTIQVERATITSTWQMTIPVRGPANSNLIADTLQGLSTITATATISAGDPSSFGLVTPTISVTLVLSDGKRLGIKIGKQETGKTDFYAQTEPPPDDQHLFTIPVADVDKLRNYLDALPPVYATQTAVVQLTATAQAVATQTANVHATETAQAVATQTANVHATETAQAAAAQTAIVQAAKDQAATQTAIAQAAKDQAATQTAVAQATATAQSVATQTASANATATAQVAATQTAIVQAAKEQADQRTLLVVVIVGGIIGLLILVVLIILIIRFVRSRRVGAEPERIPPPPPFVGPYLEAVTVPGLEFNLTRSGMTLGRGDDCDFKITDDVPGAKAISRYHARFEERNNRWVVIDGTSEGQRSTNGVYVNGKRTLENYLTDGVEIKFGEVPFRFHAQHATNNSAEGAQS